jgi:uncharacterized OsmC-like protein
MSATSLNGNDVAELREYVAGIERDPAKAERRPALTATWTGGDRSKVTIAGKTMAVNEPGTLGPMQLVLAAIAGCEIDVIATHATLMGVEIEELTVEVQGEFDVRSYLGISGAPPSGYERISYTARLRAPSISDHQLARLTEAVERASPVGDTLVRSVPLVGRIEPI